MCGCIFVSTVITTYVMWSLLNQNKSDDNKINQIIF